MADSPAARIRELVSYFLRLGALGFGGPVALCGQMEKELVEERHWLTSEEMREGIAVCQSLPGPLAIQVGIYVSYLRGGFWGAWAGGWAFILPNFLIVAALGLVYVRLGGLPAFAAIFYGVSPAVVAMIVHSCWRLARSGMEDRFQWAVAAVCFAFTVAVQAEIALLFVAAGAAGVVRYGNLRPTSGPRAFAVLASGAAVGGAAAQPILGKLFLFFLKAGSLTFGSGLVIVPFLQQGLVAQTGWLTTREFLTAVAIGMVTPGPVVITATFVGSLLAGFQGAVVATVGIFLPSFLLVLALAPILARHRSNPKIQGFVRGAYAAAIGTILGASVLIGQRTIGDWVTGLVAAAGLFVLFRWKVSNPFLAAASASVGLIAFPLLHPTWLPLR